MTKPTRRGFVGSLAAVGAVLIAPMKPLIASQDDLIKEAEERTEWLPCEVDLLDADGDVLVVKSHYKMDHTYDFTDNNICLDMGTMDRKFGPIVEIRVRGVRPLPDDYCLDITHDRVVNAGDGLQANFHLTTEFR